MPEPTIGGGDLTESRLYTFIDGPREFALHFFEGQRLIHDLALLQPIRADGFAYFREVVLSVQPMIALISRGEQMGFYIDSDDPFFRLKVEASHHGDVRCVLVPADFHEFPERMWGIVRAQRLFPDNKPPYTSVLRMDGVPLAQLVNQVLEVSYQVNCAVHVARRSDQSVMVHQLPPLARKDAYVYSAEAARLEGARIAEATERIFDRALQRPDEIEAAFGKIGFRLLAVRSVRFRCGCSKDRMVGHILRLGNVDKEDLFDPGQEALEVVCEYCRATYRVSRGDLDQAGSGLQ